MLVPFEQAIGRKCLGNKAASGTEIIQELGAEHVRTGFPIVYTSADSVFQIAAHESVIPLAELYRMCEKAREILRGPNEVGRVIARPFTGEPGHFVRTPNRHDYATPPPQGCCSTSSPPQTFRCTRSARSPIFFSDAGSRIQKRRRAMRTAWRRRLRPCTRSASGLIFVNLVDFDQQYGHRNDVEGYAAALEAVDCWLPSLPVKDTDLLILTADHGCDPTTPSTDHSREYTPLLAYGPGAKPGVPLGVRNSLADIGQTVAAVFGAGKIPAGTSFLREIQKG